MVSAATVRYANRLLDESIENYDRCKAILELAEADKKEADRYMQVAIAHYAAVQK